MNKKIFSSALFIGIFFCMAFCVGLNFANAGSVAQAGACTLKSSDCATGLYCYNGALRNYCTPQITDQTICASGSFVADSELDNCRYGCSNGKYYSAYHHSCRCLYLLPKF